MLRARHSDVVGLALLTVAVGLVSPYSTIVLVWWCGLAWGAGSLLFGPEGGARQLRVFGFYAALALVLYLTQRWAIPGYYGFSGGIGVGADDSYFYSLATDDLPFDFPFRYALAVQHHPYGMMLRGLAHLQRLVLTSLHPLDLLFFNVFGLSFLPLFVRSLYLRIVGEETGARNVFWMCVVAPYVLANGVILMRDGLVAMAFAGALWACVKRRWFVLVICLALAFWLRIASGLMLVGIVIGFGTVRYYTQAENGRWRRPDSLYRVILVLLAVLAVALVGAELIFHYPWWERVFRSGFLNSFVRNSVAMDSGTTTFYTINKMPGIVRVPLAFIFYLGSPFLQLSALANDGVVVPRAVLTTGFALLFPFYAAWFFRGVLRAWRTGQRVLQAMALMYIFDLTLVSQASMQMRHKIPLMALFYLLVAYGSNTPYNQDRRWGWVITVLVIVVDGGMNALQLVHF